MPMTSSGPIYLHLKTILVLRVLFLIEQLKRGGVSEALDYINGSVKFLNIISHLDGYTRVHSSSDDHEYSNIPFSPTSQLLLLKQRLVPRFTSSHSWNRMILGDDVKFVVYWRFSDQIPTDIEVRVSILTGQISTLLCSSSKILRPTFRAFLSHLQSKWTSMIAQNLEISNSRLELWKKSYKRVITKELK